MCFIVACGVESYQTMSSLLQDALQELHNEFHHIKAAKARFNLNPMSFTSPSLRAKRMLYS